VDDTNINAHLWYAIVIIIVCLITSFSTVVISGFKKGVYLTESMYTCLVLHTIRLLFINTTLIATYICLYILHIQA